MRLRAALLPILLSSGPAFGDETAPSPATPEASAPESAQTLQARRHFQYGIKLYRDGNYAGALAEFEAAYALKPGPSSLQNVALCHKALFRYAEASDTLRTLLARHGAELPADERRAIEQAADELAGLIGSVVVTVQPPHAQVTLNGQALGPEQRGKRLRVNVGEHTIAAEAPGYARGQRVVRVAGGQEGVPVELSLEPTAGFLDVVAEDAQAVIAVDGMPLARHRWSGPIAAGEEHLIQVYREGFEPFEQTVSVDLGKTLVLRAPEGAAVEGEAPSIELGEHGLPLPPAQRAPLGFYGLLSLDILGVGAAPLGFDAGNATSTSTAGALGLRGGYRFTRSLGAELVFQLGRLDPGKACDEARTAAATPEGQCGKETEVQRSYRLSFVRVGPSLRYTAGSERVRFLGGAGFGLVHHSLDLDPLPGVDGTGGKARGADAYFTIEAGVGLSFGHWLLEAVLVGAIEGASGLDGTLDGRHVSAYADEGNAIPLGGLSLRFGYSQWKSR